MLGNSAWADSDKPIVLSSIMPLHLIVSDIGGEAISAELLAPATISPHDFQLRPSDAKRVHSADVVLWVGPMLETYLAKLLRKQEHAVVLYPALGSDQDPHVWMDADEVQSIARRVARILSDRIPSRGAYFHANAARFSTEFRQYDKELKEEIARHKHQAYLLLHDGFSRFEQHYGLPAGEMVVSGSDRLPGARHIVQLRERLQSGEFACVFREPQYAPAMLNALVAGIDIPVIEIDPLGASRAVPSANAGADGFLGLYRQLGQAFLACFDQP
ncbi:High-affinity zinc uptake system protein ZnuA [Zhongshania aliphaticivorans]|uniref:High-affinity zinc uptake system protein ZnuA n=2 Tax=Zhongshania aliphaticivorans TaxID=1470434 RepID=A0A5S9PLG6_9GAMM|nr:High-affinity zinc uptake system protein ZnuA [Zhongshania aliphaticivorans]CAA0105176.1 High-affinity zinc uptake system protein ZnuA [Zhongshania aliphaticivorans]